MEKLISRFWPSGFLFIAGLILIIYIAFGFLYLQQGAKQKEFEEQIVKLSAVIDKPLAPDKELQAEYEKINEDFARAPKTNREAIDMLVGIAEESGIDVTEESDKFNVPPATFGQAKVGASTYQLISFRNIQVQGDYDNIMAFISNIDSGKTEETKNMVLKKVVTNEVNVIFSGIEGDRRAEFRNVKSAVINMMIDNALSKIPNPMNFAGGVAANLTGDNPDTKGTVEGFPDIVTTAAQKGYSGNGTARGGYVLYEHDKISSDNTTQFKTVSYFSTLSTRYYYTCEANGTVRQWDGPNVVRAREYLDSEESKIETKIVVDVDIYVKPE